MCVLNRTHYLSLHWILKKKCLGSHTGDELQESYCQICVLCMISVPLFVVKFDQTKPAKEKQPVLHGSYFMDVKIFHSGMESGLTWT